MYDLGIRFQQCTTIMYPRQSAYKVAVDHLPGAS